MITHEFDSRNGLDGSMRDSLKTGRAELKSGIATMTLDGQRAKVLHTHLKRRAGPACRIIDEDRRHYFYKLTCEMFFEETGLFLSRKFFTETGIFPNDWDVDGMFPWMHHLDRVIQSRSG